MFKFINITFAIVRELSIPKRFNLFANVSEIKMESEPKPSNAFEQNFGFDILLSLITICFCFCFDQCFIW